MAKDTKENETQKPTELKIPTAQPVSAPPAKAPEKPVDKSARAFNAVDYPIVACIGCNSTNTVRIDEHLKLAYHKRQCRTCGKTFKESAR